MMKKIILVLVSTFFTSCVSQEIKKDDHLNNLLTNESVVVVIKYVTTYSLDENANEVLKSKDKNLLKILLKDLLIDSKALVAHILLTKIVEPDKDVFSVINVYDDEGNVISNIYSVNSIRWIYDESTKKNIVLDYEKDKLYNFWKEKVIVR